MTAALPGGAFGRIFLGTVLILGSAAFGAIGWADPYGLRAGPGRAPGPLVDLNQRAMYPQVWRSRAYDGAVIGTSTARLLDPEALAAAFGGRFANLAMNAATPYEQREMARLALRVAPPRTLVLGLDANWCAADADRKRLTPRPFPAWLYAEGSPLDLFRQTNWQGLTNAAAVLGVGLGLAEPRYRADGYAVFTPPEAVYDPARAAAHIRAGTTPLAGGDAAGPASDAADAPMPALAWLDDLLGEAARAAGGDARRIVAFMPVHAAAQGRPGTPEGRREAACKAAVAAIGRARGALVLDFRIPSPVTNADSNYWDALHYRLPVAARIVAALKAAGDGAENPDGFYRVLARP